MIQAVEPQHSYQRRNFFTEKAPLYGVRHNMLWFGWSPEQLEKVAIELRWRELSNWQVLAAIVCSLVAEYILTGDPVRYSRSKNWYAEHAHLIADPKMAWRKVVQAMDYLLALGIIEGIMGVHASGDKKRKHSRQSIAWATTELVERIAPLLDLDGREKPDEESVLILRDKNKKALPVPDTAETRRMIEELEIYNAAVAATTWTLRGKKLTIGMARRIFNQDVLRGGRIYHRGESYQQMNKDERATIRIEIDGVACPMAEEDFDVLHVQMAYAAVGAKMPEYPEGDDPYVVLGFNRNRECKPALNSLWNASSEKAALGVIGGEILGNRWSKGRALMAALRLKHPALVPLFCSDSGARFQRTDSDMAMEVALAVLRRTGRPPLLIHDSFLVAKQDRVILLQEMKRALSNALAQLKAQAPLGLPTGSTSAPSVSTPSPLAQGISPMGLPTGSTSAPEGSVEVLSPSLPLHRSTSPGQSVMEGVIEGPIESTALPVVKVELETQGKVEGPSPKDLSEPKYHSPKPAWKPHHDLIAGKEDIIAARIAAKKAEDKALGRDRLWIS